MESVLRALVVYAFLLVVFRLAGKRTLAQTSSFELVLLLIISETIQEGLVDDDHSLTNAFLLVITLVTTSIGLSLLKRRFPPVARWLDGLPVVIVRDGRTDDEAMRETRVDDDDLMVAAREREGLARGEDIAHAVVEEHGGITVVPRKP